MFHLPIASLLLPRAIESFSFFLSLSISVSLSSSRCLVKAKVTTRGALPVVDGSRGSVRLRRETLINRVKSLEIDGRCTRPAARQAANLSPRYIISFRSRAIDRLAEIGSFVINRFTIANAARIETRSARARLLNNEIITGGYLSQIANYRTLRLDQCRPD